MDYLQNETVILNDSEFFLMLAAAGVHDFYGIEIASGREVTDDEGTRHEIMASLYRKELIEWSGGKARIAGRYRNMFAVLKHSRVCILYGGTGMSNVVSAYCHNGSVVTVGRNAFAKDEIRLTEASDTGWIEQLIEEGFLPENIDIPENAQLKIRSSFDSSVELTELIGEDDIVSAMDLRSVPDGDLLQRIVIRGCGLYGVMEILSAEKAAVDICEGSLFGTIMSRWMNWR